MPTTHTPGERETHGAQVIFDLDARNAFISDRTCESAPSDLSAMSGDELSGLFYSALNRQGREPRDTETHALLNRICAERKRREMTARIGRAA